MSLKSTSHGREQRELSQAYSDAAGTSRPVPAQRTHTGVADVDMEMLVLQRALHRLRRTLAADPAACVDIDIIEHSIDRISGRVRRMSEGMNKMLESNVATTEKSATERPPRKASIDPSEPETSQPAHYLRPQSALTDQLSDSGVFAEGCTATHRPPSAVRSCPLRITDAVAATEALEALWGTVLSVAVSADGDYALAFDRAQLQCNAAIVKRQAATIGLDSLAETLLLRAAPVIAIHGVGLPATCIPSDSRPVALEGEPLPRGLIDMYQLKHGSPVALNASSSWGRLSPSAITSRTLAPFMTTNSGDANSITVDFGAARVVPRAYGFASIHAILPGFFPRSWDLLASLDGENWSVLKRHVSDTTFDGGRNPGRIWSLDDDADAAEESHFDRRVDRMARFLRITMTGPNSFGSNELQVSNLEFYGTMICVEAREAVRLEGTRANGAETRPRGFAVLEQVAEPVIGKSKVVGGKKK